MRTSSELSIWFVHKVGEFASREAVPLTMFWRLVMNSPTATEPEPKTCGPGRLEKAPTGIQGLDEITCGGLPRGRTTLVYGGPGCGKTLLALEFLVHGATRFGEPGVFIAFEETAG